ncbi:hypothetical protein TUBRATIS_20560 [Tubulinosema ratisbonensis]|uniref:Uncharacterized protein n=1 Tax=Tubulinosema ratisbonensis TaxID=291195 RepID=A0A437AK04_9MICR|nr:hypothetical protein TUBRATIS_20560 [Tubulinosema ratisbonensis]
MIEGKECFESMPEKYFFEFCEYKKDFRDKINIVFHHNTYYFAEYMIGCILKKNSLDHISNNVSIIQHSRCSESTNQKAIAIFKLIQKAICNVDFHIICLLIPEFEEIIYLFIKNQITLQNIKFPLFIIGVTIYKLNFLKSNIKNEIKSNKKEHSSIYIESPLLKTFITSVQTILLLTIERKLELYQNIKTYKVLLFKNFLNFISTANIFKKKSDFYFFINFINEKYFTAYFDRWDRFEDIFEIFLKRKINLTDFGDIKNENNVAEKAKEFLDAIYHDQIDCIYDEVKNSILEIRNFFEE